LNGYCCQEKQVDLSRNCHSNIIEGHIEQMQRRVIITKLLREKIIKLFFMPGKDHAHVKNENKNITWPWYAGGIVMVPGIVMLVTGKKR
jgi:hypothetical protein